MPTIQHILSLATSGIATSQAQIAAASRNIANVNTPGYAHEVLPISAQLGGLGVGAGSPIALRNALLARGMAATSGRLGYHERQANALTLVEDALNDLDGVGLGTSLRDFSQALNAASANPSNLDERQQVLEAAKSLMASFSTTRTQLEQAADGTRQQVSAVVSHANALAAEVAALNGRVQAARPGEDVNSLVTRRAAVIQELSGLVGVEVLNRSDGSVQLTTAGGRPLVESTSAATLSVSVAAPPENTLSIGVNGADGRELAAMGAIGGEVGGLVDVHNESLSPSVTKIDELAFFFMDEFNTAHQAGYDLTGSKNRKFFDLPTSVTGAASGMSLSIDVDGKPEHLAAALDSLTVPGDNGNLLVLANLLTDAGVMPDGSTVEQALSDLTIGIANRIIRENAGVDLERGSLDQLSNMLASEEGVNIDEELIRVQQANTALDASSTVIREVQRMTDTILNLVG